MNDLVENTPLQDGQAAIRVAAADLPQKPGVYRMLSESGDVLYVGKAKALKRRVMSYCLVDRLPIRLQRMVALTRSMEFVRTHTETEALLLEANLIKKLKPRYNILLRDDKSFPYILLREDHDYPMVVKYRGAKRKDGRYYGPFAGAGDVMRVLHAMQRIFMLRSCTDSNFASRTRPCLQYDIKRCTAPCVGLVSKAEYAQQVREAQDFLEGRSDAVQDRYSARMEEASATQDYEAAAVFRDRLKALRAVQARQDVNFAALGDADVVALAQKGGRSCVQVFFFRGGQNFGNRSYFPRHEDGVEAADIMGAFLAQFYLNKPVPREIIISHVPDAGDALLGAFNDMSERAVSITVPQRGKKRAALDFAVMNAREALQRKQLEERSEAAHLTQVADAFGMEAPPNRIEIYDNSHISGSHMVGAMVVAGREGFQKAAYRKFNIKQAEAGDDYGMMREVMQRRFRKVAEGGLKPGDADWPDLLLIDGGAGQLSAVTDVLADYGMLEDVVIVGIAKGEERNSGRERFFMTGRGEFTLPYNSGVLHYLQRLRDEAHRYVIGAHRVRRKKSMNDNPLDQVPGIGAKKKSALIKYFGSGKGVRDAGVSDLQKVDGISEKLAQQIYDYFH